MKRGVLFLLFLVLISCILSVSAVSQNITMNMSSQYLSQSGFNAFSARVYNQTWLDFNGINSSVNFGNSSIFSLYANGNISTISVWFKLNTNNFTGNQGRQFIFSKAKASDYSYNLFCFNATSNPGNRCRFEMLRNDAGVSDIVTGNLNYSLNEWYNWIITLNGTSATVYVNGTLIGSVLIVSPNQIGAGNLTLGQRLTGGYLNGSVSDFRFYNNSLTYAQERALYYSFRNLTIIPVIMYHTIGAGVNDYDINVTNFTAQMNYLNSSGYHTITDYDYYNWTLGRITLPSKPIMLTFDDGFTSNILAAQIMANYSFRGVAAVSTGYINTVNYMNWTNVSSLINSYNWSIASHSATHCDMAGGGDVPPCNDTLSRQGNLSKSKAEIIANTGFTPISFIYPFNSWNETTMADCVLNYTMCFGSSTTYDNPKFINKISNFTNGELIRFNLGGNSTTIVQYDLALNITLNLNYLGIWKTNENNGTIVNDLSGNGNNGNISGATWNNDGILNSLTENIDYTVDRSLGTFTLLNTVYKYAFGLLSMCTESWSCDAWGSCSSGNQTRTCTDANSCGTTMTRPTILQSCISDIGFPTFTITPAQLESQNGYEISIQKNWQVEFNISNQTHTISLNNIANKTATITISSNPVTFDITLNETKKINLNGDNYYDLQVFLKSISNTNVNLIIKTINEQIPSGETGAVSGTETPEKTINLFGLQISISALLYVGAGIIAIIILIAYSFIRKKKK